MTQQEIQKHTEEQEEISLRDLTFLLKEKRIGLIPTEARSTHYEIKGGKLIIRYYIQVEGED